MSTYEVFVADFVAEGGSLVDLAILDSFYLTTVLSMGVGEE